MIDGRRQRGAESRRRLLDATLRVIERDGVAGVSHRNVTAEAGLPASSAAYHFASIIELLESAMQQIDAQSAHALESIASAGDPIAALATWLVDDFEADQRRCMVEYELFLHAARSPSLRPTALQWITDLAALVATWTPEPDAAVQRRVCAYVDGLLVHSLVVGRIPTTSEVERDLRALVAGTA